MTNIKQTEITEKYKKELEEELNTLIKKSTEIGQDLKAAREQGDLSENADYAAAREKQAINETRIQEIKDILKYAKIVKTIHIKVEYVKLKKVEEFDISGSESNPFEKKISSESPLAKAVLGHKKGDTVYMTTEAGKDVEIKILEID